MRSTIYDWSQITPEPTKTGRKRPFFRLPTDTLEQLTCHVTTLNPGEAAHAPHRHPEEEMIIVKEGTLDALLEIKDEGGRMKDEKNCLPDSSVSPHPSALRRQPMSAGS